MLVHSKLEIEVLMIMWVLVYTLNELERLEGKFLSLALHCLVVFLRTGVLHMLKVLADKRELEHFLNCYSEMFKLFGIFILVRRLHHQVLLRIGRELVKIPGYSGTHLKNELSVLLLVHPFVILFGRFLVVNVLERFLFVLLAEVVIRHDTLVINVETDGLVYLDIQHVTHLECELLTLFPEDGVFAMNFKQVVGVL
jgi:hypothetical protein